MLSRIHVYRTDPCNIKHSYTHTHTHTRRVETAILKSSAALDLLFADTEARIECYDMNPTESELTRLDSLNDPEFPTKRQYVEMAQTVRTRHVWMAEYRYICVTLPHVYPEGQK